MKKCGCNDERDLSMLIQMLLMRLYQAAELESRYAEFGGYSSEARAGELPSARE